MAKKTSNVEESAAENTNIPISIEQICAAIITTLGSVSISFANLLADYSGKSISVNQDDETKAVTFGLIDTPEIEKTESAE